MSNVWPDTPSTNTPAGPTLGSIANASSSFGWAPFSPTGQTGTYVAQTDDSTSGLTGSAKQTRQVNASNGAYFTECFQFLQYTHGGTTKTDPVWSWGYNASPAFTKLVPTEPMCTDRLEAGFMNPATGLISVERHIAAYIDPANSGGEIRPFSIYINEGADSGVGGPNHVWQLAQSGTGWSVLDTAARQLMSYGGGVSGGALGEWSFFTQVQLQGTTGSAASATLTIGNTSTAVSSVINLECGAGAVNEIQYKAAGTGVNQWLLYDAGGASFFIRDAVNGVMALRFDPAAAPNGAVKVGQVFYPVQATTVAAPAYVKGGMYFDTTLNKLRIGGATAWETVTSS